MRNNLYCLCINGRVFPLDKLEEFKGDQYDLSDIIHFISQFKTEDELISLLRSHRFNLPDNIKYIGLYINKQQKLNPDDLYLKVIPNASVSNIIMASSHNLYDPNRLKDYYLKNISNKKLLSSLVKKYGKQLNCIKTLEVISEYIMGSRVAANYSTDDLLFNLESALNNIIYGYNKKLGKYNINPQKRQLIDLANLTAAYLISLDKSQKIAKASPIISKKQELKVTDFEYAGGDLFQIAEKASKQQKEDSKEDYLEEKAQRIEDYEKDFGFLTKEDFSNPEDAEIMEEHHQRAFK